MPSWDVQGQICLHVVSKSRRQVRIVFRYLTFLLVIFSRVRKTAKSNYYLRHVCLYVRPHRKKPAPTGRIFNDLVFENF